MKGTYPAKAAATPKQLGGICFQQLAEELAPILRTVRATLRHITRNLVCFGAICLHKKELEPDSNHALK